MEYNEVQGDPEHLLEIVSTIRLCMIDEVHIPTLILHEHTLCRIALYNRIRGATFLRLAQSDRHLFCGTSTATVRLVRVMQRLMQRALLRYNH